MGRILYLPLDSNGTLTVNVRLTTRSGINRILMDPFEEKISTQISWITATADGIPYSMTGSIDHGGVLPVGSEYFILDYYLYDKYGNPIGNESLWVSTNLSGETMPNLYTSDSNGLIRIIYGPKISPLTVNITAIAKDNASVTKNLIANFIGSTPTNMVSGSHPADHGQPGNAPSEKAFVRATVIDNFGNPVPGELVTFSSGLPSRWSELT